MGIAKSLDCGERGKVMEVEMGAREESRFKRA